MDDDNEQAPQNFMQLDYLSPNIEPEVAVKYNQSCVAVD